MMKNTDDLLDDVYNLYHVLCIMPNECTYVKAENSILKKVSNCHLHVHDHSILKVNVTLNIVDNNNGYQPSHLQPGQRQQYISLESLGDQLGFQYTRHLIFFSMKDLLNSDEWQISSVEYAQNANQSTSIQQFLRQGDVISGLLIRKTTSVITTNNDSTVSQNSMFIPVTVSSSIEVETSSKHTLLDSDPDKNYLSTTASIQSFQSNVHQQELFPAAAASSPSLNSIGYGLYTNTHIPLNTFIGEYTGIVSSGGKYNDINDMSSYRLCYPSTDGGFAIDAAEYGNVTRFINHSWHPNCEIRNIFLDGIIHCVFFSIRDIACDEQLTFNYGPSYWHTRGIEPVEL